jgi:hypothetical protein
MAEESMSETTTAFISFRVPQIMPRTYEEILRYLEGRRSLNNLLSGSCEVSH